MNSKKMFGIMCILFGGYAVPEFIQGNIKSGILNLVLGIVSCSVIIWINAVKSLFLGIEILKMSEGEYQARKGTFKTCIFSAE